MPDVTIAYKNSTIASITGSGAISLSTAGRYCEDNITVDYTKPTPKLQEKTVNPTTNQQIITPDSIEYTIEIPVGTAPIYQSYYQIRFNSLDPLPDGSGTYSYCGKISCDNNVDIILSGTDTAVNGRLPLQCTVVGSTSYTLDDSRTYLESSAFSGHYIKIEFEDSAPSGGVVSEEIKVWQSGQEEYDGLSKVTVNAVPGDDPNASLYKQWALNYTESTQEFFYFKSSISSHYNFIYNLSDIIESGAFAERAFSGDFTFNSLTAVPSYAFAMVSPLYVVYHTFNFPNCSIIETGAFYSRKTLTSINLPSVGTISSAAFYQCTSLANVNIPNCTIIEKSAFYQCLDLYSISIPKCTKIGQQAFYQTGLSEIYGPSCSVIEYLAFAYCGRLITASFPECQVISSRAFYYCSNSLTTADFSICSSIYSQAFTYCYKLSNISFPKVKNIFSSAFANCSLLTTVSFPECTSIAYSAFYNCRNLQSVYLLGSQVVSLDTGVFSNTPITNSTYTGSFGSIYVPSSLLDTYKSSTNWAAISARLVGM